MAGLEKEKLNRMKVKPIRVGHGGVGHYWRINGKPVTQYLHRIYSRGKMPRPERFGTMTRLLPAWTGLLEWKAENAFIWSMVDSEECLNVPILVCEEDCNFECIAILAKIRKVQDRVYWDKIGLLSHDSYSLERKLQSGILRLQAYTNEDWKKYEDNIALEGPGSMAFREWISENWEEELSGGRRNYTLTYMQQEENICWIEITRWAFSRSEYEETVKAFRELCQANMKSW